LRFAVLPPESSLQIRQENTMSNAASPSKEQVRDWIAQRHADRKPLPDINQIRRELGWNGHPPKVPSRRS
jgi:hypothetical protein